MGIPGFFKWLIKSYPECLIEDVKYYSHINTLFIDLCQLSFRSMEFIEKKFKTHSSEERIEFFLSNLTKRVKETILTINPTDTIFAFYDGSNPAIKFQRQRERWFKKEHIDNYIIDPTEYKLSDINTDRDKLQINKLDELFKQITQNCKYLKAKRILFSTFDAPGEAEHKYFEVFRNFKQKQFWRSNQIHSIFTTDNDLIFLTLQFLDERFFIVRDFNSIIDISILRDLILYQLFQDPNLYQKENRITAARALVSHIPIGLQQQVVNDIIALSFIVGNDYLPPIPDFSISFSFSNLLISYKRINGNYFYKTIGINQNKTEEPSFSPLIVNDSICVSSLQKIVHECFCRSTRKENPDTYPKQDFKSPNPNANNNNNNNDIDRDLINENNNDNENDENNNYSTDDDNNNISKTTNINTTNDIEDNIHSNNDKNSNNSHTNNNNDTNIDKNIIQDPNSTKCDDDQNLDISKKQENKKFKEIDNLEEKSQQMLRTFNFTWLYYTKGCPSWSYYYPFKKSPPLRKAIEFMKQEGPEVFNTPGYDEKTEPMFKIFVLHPVECKESLPWCLYKLKIPPSEISHFWPLGAKNVEDIPVFDLDVMKKFYKEGKKQVRQEELLNYNKVDPIYFTYKNMNIKWPKKAYH